MIFKKWMFFPVIKKTIYQPSLNKEDIIEEIPIDENKYHKLHANLSELWALPIKEKITVIFVLSSIVSWFIVLISLLFMLFFEHRSYEKAWQLFIYLSSGITGFLFGTNKERE